MIDPTVTSVAEVYDTARSQSDSSSVSQLRGTFYKSAILSQLCLNFDFGMDTLSPCRILLLVFCQPIRSLPRLDNRHLLVHIYDQ